MNRLRVTIIFTKCKTVIIKLESQQNNQLNVVPDSMIPERNIPIVIWVSHTYSHVGLEDISIHY